MSTVADAVPALDTPDRDVGERGSEEAEQAREASAASPSKTAERAREASAASPGTTAGTARLRGVSKVHGHGRHALVAVEAVDLDVSPGEFVCLVGASGCGKSTLLNLLAGLDRPSAGTVEVSGRPTLMFQEAALFPWLDARGNVELALRLRGVGRSERRRRSTELLDVVRLGGFGDRRPHELSGGMRQRVALARALAQDADLLLMDEPFGALDAMTRDVLHDELEHVVRATDTTVVFVTHDVREAVRLADRIVVLTSRPGRVHTTIDVALDRPRRLDDAATTALAAMITDELHEEALRHGRR